MSNPAAHGLTLDGGLLPTAREAGLWVAAAAMVIAAHALAAYGFQAMRPVEMPEAAEAALVIDLSPMILTSPEAVESEALEGEIPQEVIEPVTDTAEIPQEATAPLAEAVEDDVPTATEAQPVDVAQAEPTETTAVQPDAKALPVDEAEALQPTQTASVLPETPAEATAEPIEPDAAVPAEDVAAIDPTIPPETFEPLQAEEVMQVLPDVVAALPQPRPIAEVEEAPEQPVRKAAPRKTERKAVAKAPPKARAKAVAKPAERVREAKSAKAAPSRSSAKSTASRAPSISPAKWQSRVIAWINRHKRYPSASKARGDQGQVQVNFAINASGVVVSASIGRSSGNAALDKAALDMVRRASPVPAPPPEIARNRMQLALPVQFSLR